ncbi:MAG: 4Fe-4S dicluster domain-containing protein [Chlorobium phaeobacteroides]|jgi:Fe-S oxidoreductase/nitrate reductase gamma subunit|nr:4Fe-4S dicluster domain-containing protein [Chlorobium phaeobacteroides]
MEASREIYWNIGHGVILIMYLLTIAALALMATGFRKRMLIWRQGKPLDRFDRFDERFALMLRNIFTQKKVLRVRDGGLFHALFFWSFLVLFAGTIAVMLQTDIITPLLKRNLLSGVVYKVFSLLLDCAGLLAILMLGGLFIRRFVIKPAGLETTAENYRIHLLLFAILITGFLIEGVRMAATELHDNPELAIYSPVGLLLANLFTGLSSDLQRTLHKTLWFVHLLLGLGFIALIPRTKLRHIFTTGGNSFLAPLDAKGTLGAIDLEDDMIEQFGTATIADLSWKDLFDTDACTSCKRCQDRCPAYQTGKPLSPMTIIRQLGELAEISPKSDLIKSVTSEALWACTTCGACEDICPANIEHVSKIIGMRRHLTLMEGVFPGDEVRTATSNIETHRNPFGLANASRGDWTKGLPVCIMEKDSNVDILYFAGCYASFDSRNREVARNFIRICSAAGIKAGTLGQEEQCCGEPLRKLGNEYLYQMTARENIEKIRRYGVKKIVTTCPHCFNTLSRDYKELQLDIPVEHYTTFIDTLMVQKKLKLKPEPFLFTYHDSCYLGRYMDIINEPRSILLKAGGKLSEMDASGYDGFCCGGGGGRILADEKSGTRINAARIEMAKNTGMPLLVSNCPFCLSLFEEGIKSGGYEGKLKARDLAEIVAERLNNP